MKLYVDGQLAGTNPQTGAQAYDGYWRVGGDNTWGSTSPYFTGTIDEVAVYPSRCSSAATVKQHYALGARHRAEPAADRVVHHHGEQT